MGGQILNNQLKLCENEHERWQLVSAQRKQLQKLFEIRLSSESLYNLFDALEKNRELADLQDRQIVYLEEKLARIKREKGLAPNEQASKSSLLIYH
mmetsp:Transcript_17092/g.28845  ORF Transcript_17092/g.28845 Transcript_17092/m.28845 type:complete len:96 (+) Transcript_17092:459-746(+)